MKSRIPEILDRHQTEIVADWLTAFGDRGFAGQARKVLAALRTAVANGNFHDVDAPEFDELRSLLASMSRSRALLSSKPSEAASFIFALKHPLFVQIGKSISDAPALERELWSATQLIDGLGLYAIEIFHRSREEIGAYEREPDPLRRSTADIAHDFNNLLAGIIGGLNVVRGRIAKGQTDDIPRFVDEIVNYAHRASSLTQELLANAQLPPRPPAPSDQFSPRADADDIEGL